MYFEEVRADAFGPFRDETLGLAPGMNVIYGPNEAGKSTWHAALYAGLCGLRRGAGRSTFNEGFSARHRPWDDPSNWRVGVIVKLADGRRVELSHDLANRVDSWARDADLAGRDYSDEIPFEGAPDGSRWLGLNRVTFLSTACIRQTDLMGVLDEASSLQEHIQKAADSAGDTTAKRALDLIDRFRSEAVGSDRAPTKPLRMTASAVESAGDRLAEAERAQREFLDRHAEVDLLERELTDLAAQQQAAGAVLAETMAETASQRLSELREMAGRFPDGAPHLVTDDEELSNQIATALQKWQSRSIPTPLEGEDIETLERQIAGIDHQIEEIEQQASQPVERRRRGSLLVSAIVATVLGLGGFAIDTPIAGAGLLALAIGLLVGWLVGGAAPVPTIDYQGEIERLSGTRHHTQHLIADRRQAEAAHAESSARHQHAFDVLLEAATAIGQEEADPEVMAEALFSWQKERRLRLNQLADDLKEWDRYQQLLGRQSLEDAELELAQLQGEAAASVAASDPDLVAGFRTTRVTTEDLRKITEQSLRARDELNVLNGELRSAMINLPSVAEAEETLDRALLEAQRVRELDEVLTLTSQFLEAAEAEVHRSLAPVLTATVERWLSHVTDGRYTRCKVDPETLLIEVQGPGVPWRRAELLSHGTREQIYLLLRMALARHLTRPDEVSPLILDDVLTSFDSSRRDLALKTLHAISAETQVVLFSHDEDVARWAERHFDGTRDLVRTLTRTAN